MANARLIGLKKDQEKNKQLYDELFVSDSGYRLVSSSPKIFSAIHKDDFGENFYISEEELNYYVDGFIQAITDNIEKVKESAINEGYFFNNYGQTNVVDGDDKRSLFEHFSFVNRTNGDIGKKAVIDFSYLSNLSNSKNGQGPTQSLYESITNLLTKNNFEFFAMPNLIGYSNSKDNDLEDMFKAIDGPLNRIPSKPGFICMFIGGNSRTLDIPRSYCTNNGISFDFVDDSFDIDDPSTYPEDFINNGGITAFKVKYGQEAQNHFKSIELDQTEFKETQESLMVIDAISNPSSGADPAQIGKGNNIYDMYLTRNYSCTINTMGNMQIQPMMMFKLENVPMFKGTYLITSVSHSIKPHNVETSFKGVRQPIVTVPIVTEALSLLDLALVEPLQGDAALNRGVGTTSLPADQVFESNGDGFNSGNFQFNDSSSKQCPSYAEDGGVQDGYRSGTLIKIRVCKVKVEPHSPVTVNVDFTENTYKLLIAVRDAGFTFKGMGGFRTMDQQIACGKKNGCKNWPNWTSSKQCKTPTAAPGYSNHQFGVAIDFDSRQMRPGKPEREWMDANAAKYGFINWPVEDWHWSIDGK